MAEDRTRAELYASFANRAMLYHHIHEAAKAKLGAEAAAEMLKAAIYARGLEVGRRFAKHGPSDMQGVHDAFLAFLPDGGRMFQPEVKRCDAGGVDIKFHACPLKQAWQEAGLTGEQIATLCHIAGRVDDGTFAAAGFNFSADTWKPGEEGCCHLHIRPGLPR